MTDIPESTLDMLSRLLGKRAETSVYRGSLTDLFLDDAVPEDVRSRLRASRELVQRWMLEEMRRLPVLKSPKTVHQYLAVFHYAKHEREVFACLFLAEGAHGDGRWSAGGARSRYPARGCG